MTNQENKKLLMHASTIIIKLKTKKILMVKNDIIFFTKIYMIIME